MTQMIFTDETPTHRTLAGTGAAFAAVVLLAVLFGAAPTAASTCEATFAKKGNPITGLSYTALQSVNDLSTANAINQLRGIVLARGYDVLATEAEAGSMLIEQPQTADRRSFQIVATATTDGGVTTVQLRAKLRGGQFTKDDAVRGEMCDVLAQLQGGKPGIAAANRGRDAVQGGGKPTAMTAQALSQRLSAEFDKNAETIPLRYKGRSFTLSGRVAYVRRDGDTYRVQFEIMDPSDMVFKLPGQSTSRTEIGCLLAKGQSVYALTLKPKASVTLTGTYYDYRDVPYPPIMWLSECRPAG
ncbi:MAG: hypothetical protein MUC44_15275 [Beijerinckiaceae bacterium]|jgi:hypothetical protein|nr:hypothetical protein [Beijerinckiaceae bacterium]